MMPTRVRDSVSHDAKADAWDRFVAQHPEGSLLQTTQWGRLKSAFGWDWDLVTIGAEGPATPDAGAMVLYRKLPLGLGSLAYVPRGPLVAWADPGQVDKLFVALNAAVRRRRAWACWIEPEILEAAGAPEPPAGGLEPQLADLGYRRTARTIQPRSTIVVDIAASEDDILMAMKSKTRYNIRLAERKGVTVREGTLDDVDLFYDLMEETGERDEFGIHARAYYRRAYELFADKGQVGLLLAEYKGEPLAGLLAFAVGHKAWYISGASSDRHRNLMPAYAVQWAAIRWARACGCTTYDLWGIPDEEEATLEAEFTERSDGLWGVYRFKRGFGGEVVRYTGMWEYALNPLYPIVARLYQRLR